MSRRCCCSMVLLVAAVVIWDSISLDAVRAAAPRLDYLDGDDPYYPSRTFPRLTTPQWIGEEGVEAAVLLSIDDMRDALVYERYLRPLLDRLKEIDGRAPVSIFTNQIAPDEPQLQKWLAEGLSFEIHTIDHPCPCLAGGDLAKAASTFERCVDLINQIPGHQPVAFRMPCCDSLNTFSPRFLTSVLKQCTARGHFLQADSSVFNVVTADDPLLPRSLVFDEQGGERFRRYLPFPSFVNTIDDYPYPYPIGHMIWEFPCVVPSDWSAQHVQQPHNPQTVDDWKHALDAVVLKQGAFTLVFHPHNWIRPQQLVELVDYAARTYGQRIRFLTFREAVDRLNCNLLAGRPLRDAQGRDNHQRLIDLDGDGLLDVVSTGSERVKCRLWRSAERRWKDVPVPLPELRPGSRYELLHAGIFAPGSVSLLLSAAGQPAMATYTQGAWRTEPALLTGMSLFAEAARVPGVDSGLRFRDLDGDGIDECLVASASASAVFGWRPEVGWQPFAWAFPPGARVVDAAGSDAGLRMVDADDDGHPDLLYSNETEFGLYLFESLRTGWSRQIKQGRRSDAGAIPMIARQGTNNGAWFRKRCLWVHNEDTQRQPDHVERMTFNDMLRGQMQPARDASQALHSLRPRPGYQVELMAAEPLVMDPVAIAFGPDGRLWVAEMGDYPRGINGQGAPGGRVRYLEDTDSDGRYDRSTLFLDRLSYANGVAPWRDGVLITAAPDILFAADTDGDGCADRVETLYTGFSTWNPQHLMNGLKWGLDGWLYCANGDAGGSIRSVKTGTEVDIAGRDFRIQPDEGWIDAQSGMSQFGRNRDSWGNWFGCNNTFPMFHFALADQYLRRNPHFAPPEARVQVSETPGAAPVFPISITGERYNDFWAANRFTSANSTLVYRDDLFPGGESNVFISEPVHNLVSRQVMRPRGLTFSSRRAVDEQDREFLASTDGWFRPAMLAVGPDGALWVADMYRQTIEHPEWIPLEAQKRLDLRAGEHQGRIYRVFPIDRSPRPMLRLDGLPPEQLVAALDSPSGIQRDLAQQVLYWRRDPAAIDPLRQQALHGRRPECRLQSLCTLALLDGLDETTLGNALADVHSEVRRQAIRLVETAPDRWPRLVAVVVSMYDDPDLQVQLQRAYSLGQFDGLPVGDALARLLITYPTEPFLVAAVFSSLTRDSVGDVLEKVLSSELPAESPEIVERLVGQAVAFDRDELLRRVAARLLAPDEHGEFATWRFSAIAGLASALSRRGMALEETAGQNSQLDAVIDAALAVTQADTVESLADNRRRLAAIRLVGVSLSRRPEFASILAGLLTPHTPIEIQSAAIEWLGSSDDGHTLDQLLDTWSSHSPQIRGALLDTVLSKRTRAESLVRRLKLGTIALGDLDAARRQQLLETVDPTQRADLEQMFDLGAATRGEVIDQYAAAAEVAGSAEQGSRLFAKHCSSCHRLGEVGYSVGPDLSALTNTSPQFLLTAILDPNRAVESKFVSYVASTTDGFTQSGILAAETGNSITLRGAGAKEQVVLRSELDLLQSSGKSLMPEGFEKDLSVQDVADVMAFLRTAGPKPKDFVGNRPIRIAPGPKGTFVMKAADCEIYGRTLVLEGKYGNLGFWQSDDDRAVWNLTVDAPGEYELVIDYACDDSSSGNRLLIEAGRSSAAHNVAGTGGWDNYHSARVGVVSLRPGNQQLIARPGGALHGSLLDLRAIRLIPRRSAATQD